MQTPEKKQSETTRGRKRKPEIQSESSQGECLCVKLVVFQFLISLKYYNNTLFHLFHPQGNQLCEDPK